MKKTTFLLLLFSITLFKSGLAQTYADKKYYLIDSLDLTKLTKDDKILLDSCLKVVHTAKHDTDKVNAISTFIEACADDEVWPKYNTWVYHFVQKKLEKEVPTSVKLALRKTLAGALNNIGFIYMNQGDIPKALEYYSKSLKIKEEIGDKQGIASSLNNIGFIYKNQGDIPKALEYYSKSLKIQEEIVDKQGIATSLNNIGFIYHNQGDIPKALEYYGKSLKIKEEIGDKQGIAYSLNNLGYIFDIQGDIPKALEYYGKSLKIGEEIGNKQGVARSLNNIGLIYQNQGDPSITSSKEDALRAGILKALEYYGKSLKLEEEIGNKQGVARSLNNIGVIYLKQKNNTKALAFLSESMKISKEIGFPANIRNAAQQLSTVYQATGNYQLALENYQLYVSMRDSINNEETEKASIKSHLKYEYEKKAAADSVAFAKETEIKNIEIDKQKAELKAKRNQQYGLFGGLFLILVFAAFMYNRFKVTQKQKATIENQKTEVEKQKAVVEKAHLLLEEKNEEILASIRYAKRIQDSIMTSQKYIERNINRLKNN